MDLQLLKFKEKESGMEYWLIFEFGKINQSLLCLPDYQMKLLIKEYEKRN